MVVSRSHTLAFESFQSLWSSQTRLTVLVEQHTFNLEGGFLDGRPWLAHFPVSLVARPGCVTKWRLVGYEQKWHQTTGLSSLPFPSASCCLFCDHGEEPRLTAGTGVTSWGEQSHDTGPGPWHGGAWAISMTEINVMVKPLFFEVWFRQSNPYPDLSGSILNPQPSLLASPFCPPSVYRENPVKGKPHLQGVGRAPTTKI